jgi:hypothetical protein
MLRGFCETNRRNNNNVGNCPQPFHLTPQGRMQIAGDWALQVHNPESGTEKTGEGDHLTTIYSSDL